MKKDISVFENIDCFEYFDKIKDNSIDLILTDPPFGIKYVNGWSKSPQKKLRNDRPDDLDWVKILANFYRILKPNKTVFIHCKTTMLLRIADAINCSKFKYSHDFVWLKGDMGYGNLKVMGTTHELIIVLSKGSAEKIRPIEIDQAIKKRYPAIYYGKLSPKEYYGHPTQKPVGLLNYIISARTDIDDVVFDPFCGVASTLIACKVLNRRYIGLEIDKEFYKLGSKRLNDDMHLTMYKEQLAKGLKRFNGAVCYNKP